MKTMTEICVAAAALCAVASPSWADNCARPQEAAALSTAALQQRLMVAALTCNEITLYNRFVLSYRAELQQSDSALQGYFTRVSAHTGEADYHAYKTRMANEASLSSVRDASYCARAKAAFDDALEGGKVTLAAIVESQPMSNETYAACGDGTAEPVKGESFRLPQVTRTADRRN